MRDVPSVPDTCTKMFDMSIQEVNGKGPKKRKKSLERICDNEGREPSAAGAGGVRLLHWRDMPQHLQFNPYVLTGYRPLQGWADCVRSLFYFHNETINILTHGNYSYLCYITLSDIPSGITRVFAARVFQPVNIKMFYF
jgi:hypothetical protein